LWLAAIGVGIAAGYGALGLRWAISGVQFIAFGEAGEALASAARTLPVWSVLLAPFSAASSSPPCSGWASAWPGLMKPAPKASPT
jgi:hypothetical protein